MPQWLWILIGILLAIVLVVWLAIHTDVNTQGSHVLGVHRTADSAAVVHTVG